MWSSAATVIPHNKSTEMWSSAAPFHHDIWYFRHKSRTGSTRTASPRRINSDHKKSTRIIKKGKISRRHLPFTRHFVFFFFRTNSWLRKLILFLFLLILMIHQWAAHIHFQWTFSTWRKEKSNKKFFLQKKPRSTLASVSSNNTCTLKHLRRTIRYHADH